MFGSLLKAAVGVVTLPIDIAVDIITLPQKAHDDQEFNTAKKGRNIMQNLHDAANSSNKDVW